MQRLTRRAITLVALIPCILFSFACPPNEVPRVDDEGGDGGDGDGERDGGPTHRPGADEGEITIAIAAPAAHPLGAELILDGSGTVQSEGRLLSYAWSVTAPEGEACELTLGDTTLDTLAFTPRCPGAHDVRLTASTLDGKSESKSVTVEVVQVTLSFGDIEPAPRGQSARVFVNVEHGAVPRDVLTPVLEVIPRAPASEPPEVSGDGNPFLVPMLEPLATYDLVARLQAGGETVSNDVTASVTALNSAPTVSNLRLGSGPLTLGGTGTLLADVYDAEGDPITCEASVTAGNATGFGITPATAIPTAGVCELTLDLPPRMEQWTLTVTASDGNATSLPATIDVQPANDPPSLSVSVEGPTSRAYACEAPGACASEAFTLVLDITDDIDDVDDLDVRIESDASALPPGVELAVELHPSAPDKWLVRFERDSYGPMKGVWPVTITVTEATAVDDLVASTSQTVELEVTNLSPTASALPGSSTHHTYSASEGYTGTLRFEANVADPEGNTLELVPTLVSCPTAAAGAAACGGAELELELLEATLDGSGKAQVRYAVSASSLAALVGTYTLNLEVIDPDGASTSLSGLTSSLQNRAPVVVATRSVHHSYTGGQYRATFTAIISDPDGDPLTTDLQVRCPNGQTKPLGQGCNGTTPVVSMSGEDIVVTSAGGSTSGFLGDYRIQGTISDGVANVGGAGTTVSTLTVQNRPPPTPTLVVNSSKLECNHKTASGVVTNEPGCDFTIVANGTDPDGDPVRLHFRMDGPPTFRDLASPALTTSTPRLRSFGLEVSWDDYHRGYRKGMVRAYHSDAFGAQSDEFEVEAILLNRPPVWGNNSSLTPRRVSGSYGILETVKVEPSLNPFEPPITIARPFNAGDTEAQIATGPKACFPPQLCSNQMPFTVHFDVSDPDGDPVDVYASVSCTPFVQVTVDGKSQSMPIRNRPSIPAHMAFSNALCSNNHVYTPVTGLGPGVKGITCVLQEGWTVATDGLGTSAHLPASKSQRWRVPADVLEGQCL